MLGVAVLAVMLVVVLAEDEEKLCVVGMVMSNDY